MFQLGNRLGDVAKRHYNQKGKLHRIDGPAVSHIDGSQYWYYNGRLHRADGPAIIAHGSELWFLHGVEFETITEFVAATSMTASEKTILLVKYGK